MTISVCTNFISEAEQEEIIAWAAENKHLLDHRLNLTAGNGRRLSNKVRSLEPLPLLDEIEARIPYTNIRMAKLIMHETNGNTSEHIDQYGTQQRANILVKAADEGGIFEVEGVPIDFPERAILYYYGDTSHEVTELLSGERILLSHFYRPIIAP